MKKFLQALKDKWGDFFGLKGHTPNVTLVTAPVKPVAKPAKKPAASAQANKQVKKPVGKTHVAHAPKGSQTKATGKPKPKKSA